MLSPSTAIKFFDGGDYMVERMILITYPREMVGHKPNRLGPSQPTLRGVNTQHSLPHVLEKSPTPDLLHGNSTYSPKIELPCSRGVSVISFARGTSHRSESLGSSCRKRTYPLVKPLRTVYGISCKPMKLMAVVFAFSVTTMGRRW